VNIAGDATNYNISVAAPGLHKKDLKIEADESILTVSERKAESKEDNAEKYTRQEYNFSSFSACFGAWIVSAERGTTCASTAT
jgi:HSP20 family protein